MRYLSVCYIHTCRFSTYISVVFLHTYLSVCYIHTCWFATCTPVGLLHTLVCYMHTCRFATYVGLLHAYIGLPHSYLSVCYIHTLVCYIHTCWFATYMRRFATFIPVGVQPSCRCCWRRCRSQQSARQCAFSACWPPSLCTLWTLRPWPSSCPSSSGPSRTASRRPGRWPPRSWATCTPSLTRR